MKLKIVCGCGTRYIEVNDDIVDRVKIDLRTKTCPLCNTKLGVTNG